AASTAFVSAAVHAATATTAFVPAAVHAAAASTAFVSAAVHAAAASTAFVPAAVHAAAASTADRSTEDVGTEVPWHQHASKESSRRIEEQCQWTE
ncbi:MAG: hypothetical protein OEV00_12815, partial [Acidobacteriota bacterium]|nr:hypothetical protein [Acidobacteriota bacterium]